MARFGWAFPWRQKRLSLRMALIVPVAGLLSGLLLLSAEWLYIHPSSPSLGAALSVLADFVPMAIATVGIIMSYRAPRKENHFKTTLILVACGIIGTGIMSWTRIRSEQAHEIEVEQLGTKIDKVGEQNTRLGNFLITAKDTGRLSEADRRKGIEATLRSEYILAQNPIDPQILAGNKMPPQEWMNKRLAELGETWSVAETTPRTAIPRSYIVLDGNPKFAGPNAAGIEGSPFVAGSPIQFNVHFKNTGPNILELGEQAAAAYLRDDYKPETQDALLAEFTNEIKTEKKEHEKQKMASHAPTIGAGTSEFFTATGWSDKLEPILFTQDDLDRMKSGTKFAFVISEIAYKDAGVLHHFQMCMWLQPPATPDRAWHFCDLFNASD